MDNNSCTIGLGSNTPDREYQIKKAIEHICGYLSKCDISSVYGRTQVDTLEGIIPIDLDLVIWNQHIKRPKDFERHYFNQGYRELLSKGSYEIM